MMPKRQGLSLIGALRDKGQTATQESDLSDAIAGRLDSQCKAVARRLGRRLLPEHITSRAIARVEVDAVRRNVGPPRRHLSLQTDLDARRWVSHRCPPPCTRGQGRRLTCSRRRASPVEYMMSQAAPGVTRPPRCCVKRSWDYTSIARPNVIDVHHQRLGASRIDEGLRRRKNAVAFSTPFALAQEYIES